jgi:hypothetical protein
MRGAPGTKDAFRLRSWGDDGRAEKTAHATKRDRLDILKRREAWFECQLDLDPERLER